MGKTSESKQSRKYTNVGRGVLKRSRPAGPSAQAVFRGTAGAVAGIHPTEEGAVGRKGRQPVRLSSAAPVSDVSCQNQSSSTERNGSFSPSGQRAGSGYVSDSFTGQLEAAAC